MNAESQKFIEHVISVKNNLLIHRQIALEAKADGNFLQFYDTITSFLDRLNSIVATDNLKVNYLNQFSSHIDSFLDHLPYIDETSNRFVFGNERQVMAVLTSHQSFLKQTFESILFKLDFFKTLGFFNDNVAVIGANGSGKTSVSNKLKEYMTNNGVVISAQRILLVPDFNSITNPKTAFDQLKQNQQTDKTNKSAHSFPNLQSEFQIILKSLLAENISIDNEYRKIATQLSVKGEKIPSPPISNLDKTFELWNSLITHRKISCNDGMNINVTSENGIVYPIIQMSDGEKVMLFLIAQVLQAPVDGFIIVDEPEMYLHKTILKKLWDDLENTRPDCIFIYLTHDLDFATSRITAKKIWIKSFTYPSDWDMEVIPENELPESLLMELLGSRKNILFCEGEKGKIDEKIYNLLFPKYTISPVGGCFEVISHTKAFNKIPNINIKARGLIDSDHHPPERLSKLKSHSVFHFKVAEVENLLMDEQFLTKLASNIMADSSLIENIKAEVIDELNKKKEVQASNFVSARIDYYFKDSNIVKGNAVQDLKSNFSKFTDEIKIQEFYEERIAELEKIIASKDYLQVIAVFNNKSIKNSVEKYFRITDFTERAIKLLQFDKSTHQLILKYFPEELVKR